MTDDLRLLRGGMHRFFVDESLAVGREVTLTGAVAHQIGRVLRLRPGATIVLLDGSGREFPVELTGLTAREAVGRVVACRPNEAEPATAVTLYVAPLKGDHFAWTLQKATEVGAAAFVPVLTARTVAGGDVGEGTAKLERWRRIVREAAEQSRGGRIPPIRPPLDFAAACDLAAVSGPALLPWEEERVRGLGGAVRALGPVAALGLFIGPEGGFTPDEVATACARGIVTVTLGPRTLRAETAAVVATALALAFAAES
ncbi:MAG TPA: RsmE family RNA methyltransferase [Thermomicrobiales bacterium]|nr:RsmE family RNA methyltransferase [Thermomicrobiales bacterium]